MILLRLGFNLVGLLLSGVTGWYGLQYLTDRMLVPPLAGLAILLCFVGGSLIVINYIGLQLFPPSEVEVVRHDMPRQPWAWLRLRGETMKPGFPINKGTVAVGRDVACEVMVNHASVSRKHAEIVRLAEGYLLRDLGSRNGTFINGQRVQEYLLQDGDLVSFGDVQLFFQGPKRTEEVDLDEPEHLSVSQLLSPEPLPLETDIVPGMDLDDEGGTEVWRRTQS